MTSGVFHSVAIDSITVIEELRQRKKKSPDHIPNLAQSIQTHGLIHPIVITRDHILVAGESRLTAVRDHLGWTNIPVQYQDEVEEWVLCGIELEENIGRVDLDWKDKTRAIAKYHELRKAADPTWNQTKTAAAITLAKATVTEHLQVAANLSNPTVANAVTFDTARNTAKRIEELAFQDTMHTIRDANHAHQSPIQIADFHDWAPSYSGPKFTIIHCDFPYGINADDHQGQNSQLHAEYDDDPDIYWELLSTLTLHLDRFCADFAHMFFWFSPKYHHQTWEALQQLEGFKFDPYPLIWLRGENGGIAPDTARRPRRIYETAFFGWRGDRKIIHTKANAFTAPPDRTRHPHEKSVVALQHFFEMCVDGNTRLFDPTCGSGSALRAARNLGARDILGLESNPEYADAARRALDP